MADLTKEYLDKKLDKLATNDDIKRIDNKIDGLESSLKSHMEEEMGKLATMTANGF